ncbi:taste receptor type 2 member 40-like [Prinia subflava]|uniref:taste receptor type 2 member 40-like n=1 Tax=Prinia subflava TaxID=208062 RepID=UPI002FDF9FD6
MLPPFALLCLSMAIIEAMAGTLGAGIILAASSLSCMGSKTWPPYDLIMVSLSSSRFILQSWTTLDLFFNYLQECSDCEENIFVVFRPIYMALNCSGLWFGAWLSVFYCVKVASFTEPFFIWLKQRIARLVPWMLLTSWLCSITATIPLVWNAYRVHNNFTAPSSLTNSSAMRTTRKDSLTLLIYLGNASTALPLILSVVSSVLLVRSLWIHTRQMQNNASGFRDPSLQAHMKAIKAVCSFLILYIVYFICVLLILFSGFSLFSSEELICIVLITACPTGHTLVLIWSNPKFQELPAKIWHHVTCHVRTASM